MSSRGFGVALTAVNLVAVGIIVGHMSAPADAATSPATVDLVRTRAFELVDRYGQVRSRLNVEPDGEVVLRLVDPQGQIRVKLGAAEHGSGLVLLDEATEPGVQIVARKVATKAFSNTTSVTVKGAGGKEQVIAP